MQEKKPSLEETLMQFMASTAANFKTMETQIVTLGNGRELQEVVKEPTKAKGNEVIYEENERGVEASLDVKALEQMPSYVKFMKDILSKKRRLGDYKMVALTEEYPGSFTIPCTIGTHFLRKALCNLGASVNLMPYSIYRTLGLGEAKPTSITLQLADSSLTYPKGVIEDILVKVDKFIFPPDFVVLDMEVDSEIPIILGRPFLATGRTLIDVQNGKLTMRVQDQQITFNVFKVIKFPSESDECFSISILGNLVGKESIAERPLDPLERALLDLADEENEEDLKVMKILDASKFFKSKGVESLERIAPSKVLKPSIEEPPTLELKPLSNHLRYAYLENDQKPSIERQRMLNPIMKEVVKKEIIKWLDAEIIYPISDSSWKGGTTVVPNMHNELIPTRTMLDRLVEKEFYCFLDGYSGYNQIAIAPKNQEKTTFTYMIEIFLEVFIDDFSVYGNSFDECLNNLSIQEGIVFGYKVSNRGIEVDKANLKTIEKLPPSTSVKGVCSFLGHAGFYRYFIKDFFKISKPLCNLLEKDVPFKFDDTCHRAFNDLKGRLIYAPIITVPDWSFPFELMCDASDFAIGAVLGQRKDKIFRSIYEASKTFNDAQLNYTTTEKNYLLLSYLVGTKVIMYTDHSAIKYLIEKKDAKPKLIRWVLLLQEFDLEFRDRKGTENQITDHLSRLESPAKTDKPNLINDNFPDEQLLAIIASNVPWYANIVNYLACEIIPFDLSTQQKKKRYVPKIEMNYILEQCHASPYGGYFQGDRTAAKILQSSFYWPNLFKDAHSFVANCDRCQRIGNILRRHKMPLNTILEVELFDVWGIDFMGPFVPSFGNMYSLVVIDYVSKWVETIAVLKKTRFGTPRAIISDGGIHCCNRSVEALLSKYGVKHKISTHHPQTSGQVEVSNREIKRILEKTISSTRMSPYNLVFGKACHFDMQAAGEKRLLQLNELDEFRLQAYENAEIYKEKRGQYVLLFNSRLKLFPGKLKFRWSGPFRITEVFTHGVVELENENSRNRFKVNAQRIKHYYRGVIDRQHTSITLNEVN
ncbi:DNA-directed DNA polymerase [Handroanthus impetiginosus]|uniref:RNA-directed DNA polymerase n=1 Tax=Handroanthus impetiginosus TaxID=429701 RepID=A0A2G9HH35_9LAMI|nr:DNA-directed DNA polymerase [Handroanthus impetiginosus]